MTGVQTCALPISQDEIAICSNGQLARLDNLVSQGYQFVRNRFGFDKARDIGRPLLNLRRQCGSDYNCIRNAQIHAIKVYSELGAPLSMGSITLPTIQTPTNNQQQATIPTENQISIPSQSSGKRIALIIGNARYEHAGILQNPTRDAALLASTLRSIGFNLVITQTDLNREQTIRSLREFAVHADTADWAVFYYSGHGIELGGTNYIIPVDAQLKADRDVDLEAVNVAQVLSSIEGARRLRVVILDACRVNPFASQMRRTIASKSLGRGLARIEPEVGTLVVYAAKHGETALDGSGINSPFVESLSRRILQQPGLEIRRLFDVVRDDVLLVTNKKQQPFSYGSISGSEDFFFLR